MNVFVIEKKMRTLLGNFSQGLPITTSLSKTMKCISMTIFTLCYNYQIEYTTQNIGREKQGSVTFEFLYLHLFNIAYYVGSEVKISLRRLLS